MRRGNEVEYAYGGHYNQVVNKTEYGYGGTTRLHRAWSDYENGASYGGGWINRHTLTTVKRYANAATLDEATAVVETRAYDACGNVVTLATACCKQTSFEFNAGTRYAWPTVIRRGSPTDTTKQNVTDYGYDLNTGLLVNSHDTNGNFSAQSAAIGRVRQERRARQSDREHPGCAQG